MLVVSTQQVGSGWARGDMERGASMLWAGQCKLPPAQSALGHLEALVTNALMRTLSFRLQDGRIEGE